MLTVGSVFSGIGGLDLGLERAGMQVMWQCEIDDRCREVLARWWPDVPRYGDVARLGGADVPAVDVLAGGFPCQDLSVAGRRAGLDGARCGLWWEFARLVAEIGPTWVVVENVPGLLSSRGGRDMGAVLGTLAELGMGFAWRVLDAQWFRLAQRRKRVLIVGCAGDDGRRAAQVLLEPEGCGRSAPPSRPPGTTVAHAVRASTGRRGTDDPDRVTMTVETSESSAPIAFAHQAGGNAAGWFDVDRSLTLIGSQSIAVAIDDHDADSQRVRRLLPVECGRLQGFPDHWNDWLPDSVRYRQYGNAVAVPVAEWIGRRIVAVSRGVGAP